MTTDVTDFPTKGDNKKVSLKNSQYPQFDYAYAKDLKDNYPKTWKKGGNIRGNQAFNYWGKARDGDTSDAVLSWIKEREAWAARHYKNKRLAGVVALIKWGVIGAIGQSAMKELVNEAKQKEDAKKETSAASLIVSAADLSTEQLYELMDELTIYAQIETIEEPRIVDVLEAFSQVQRGIDDSILSEHDRQVLRLESIIDLKEILQTL